MHTTTQQHITPATAPRLPATPVPPTTAAEAFAREGLPMPPVPPTLARALRPVSDWVFATRALAAGPYALAAHVQDTLGSATPGDWAAVGFDGHGSNSWAAHYYLVQGPLALFVQLPWGGAFARAEEARTEIHRLFDWSATLQERVQALQARGRWPTGQRLLVVATRRGRPGWAWVPPVSPESPMSAHSRDALSELDWQPATGMRAAIDKALQALSP